MDWESEESRHKLQSEVQKTTLVVGSLTHAYIMIMIMSSSSCHHHHHHHHHHVITNNMIIIIRWLFHSSPSPTLCCGSWYLAATSTPSRPFIWVLYIEICILCHYIIHYVYQISYGRHLPCSQRDGLKADLVQRIQVLAISPWWRWHFYKGPSPGEKLFGIDLKLKSWFPKRKESW